MVGFGSTPFCLRLVCVLERFSLALAFRLHLHHPTIFFEFLSIYVRAHSPLLFLTFDIDELLQFTTTALAFE